MQVIIEALVIIGQAIGIWIVVARNEAARPAPRAVLATRVVRIYWSLAKRSRISP